MRMASGRPAILLSIAVVLMALLAPACSEKTVSVNVDEMVAKALAAPSSVVSYQVDHSVEEDMRGEVDGERVRAEITMDMTVVIDETNRKMKADLTLEYDDSLHPAAGFDFSCREFAIGEDWYVGGWPGDDEEEIVWQKLDMNLWEKSEMLAQQLALLEQAEPEYVGEEEVDGVACHVLEFAPDMAGTLSIMSQQGVFGDDMQMPKLKAEGVKDAKTKQWIAADDSRLMKAEVQFAYYMAARDIDPSFETGGIDMEVTGELFFHHYNEPVSIEVPPEAIEQTS